MSDDRTCPDCQTRMVFSGDGRDLLCERCGSRRPLRVETRESVAELITQRRMVAGVRPANRSMRQTLKQGIGEVHNGRPDAADFYFREVILRTGDHEEEMEAWLWLSRLVGDPAEKRLCLEKVLAINPANGEARRELAVVDGRIDPAELGDAPAEGSQGVQAAAAERMQCARCAGEMAYNPDLDRYACPYCGYEEEAAAALDVARDEQFGQGALEQDFDAAVHTVKGHTRPEQMRVMHCQGCATEFVLGPETLSLTCPYCSSVYVTEAAETAALLPPQGVIPFDLTRDDAQGVIARWFKERRIGRREVTNFSPLTGLYLPVWTFDIGGEVQWHGKIIRVRGDQRSGRATAIPVFNSKYVFFDDVMIPAAKSEHRVGPFEALLGSFELAGITPYDSRLLASWPAERYAVPLAEAAGAARGRIGRKLRQMPHGLEGGSNLDEKSIRCSTQGVIVESYKLLLLPVWTLHYERDGERHELLVNGQNGRVFGSDRQDLLDRLTSWFKR